MNITSQHPVKYYTNVKSAKATDRSGEEYNTLDYFVRNTKVGAYDRDKDLHYVLMNPHKYGMELIPSDKEDDSAFLDVGYHEELYRLFTDNIVQKHRNNEELYFECGVFDVKNNDEHRKQAVVLASRAKETADTLLAQEAKNVPLNNERMYV